MNSERKKVFGEELESNRMVMEHYGTIAKASFRKRRLEGDGNVDSTPVGAV